MNSLRFLNDHGVKYFATHTDTHTHTHTHIYIYMYICVCVYWSGATSEFSRRRAWELDLSLPT